MTLDPHTKIALLQEALECERATWRRHWKERDQAALTAERQLAEVRGALAGLVALTDMKVPEGTSLKAYRAHRAAVWNRVRAALQDRAPDKQWIRGHVGGSSPTTGNGDEP